MYFVPITKQVQFNGGKVGEDRASSPPNSFKYGQTELECSRKDCCRKEIRNTNEMFFVRLRVFIVTILFLETMLLLISLKIKTLLCYLHYDTF